MLDSQEFVLWFVTNHPFHYQRIQIFMTIDEKKLPKKFKPHNIRIFGPSLWISSISTSGKKRCFAFSWFALERQTGHSNVLRPFSCLSSVYLASPKKCPSVSWVNNLYSLFTTNMLWNVRMMRHQLPVRLASMLLVTVGSKLGVDEWMSHPPTSPNYTQLQDPLPLLWTQLNLQLHVMVFFTKI